MRRGRFSEAGNRARMMLGEIQEMYFVELRPENPTIAIFEAKSALKRLNHALFWHNRFQQSIKNKNTTVLRKKHLSQKRKDSLYWKKGTIPPFNAEPVRLGLMRSL